MKRVVETLLFITDHPLGLDEIKAVLGEDLTIPEVAALVTELRQDYVARQSPLVVREAAGGWQLSTDSTYAPYVRRLFKDRLTVRLSTSALETLSIIAYKQPITRGEIEEIRGVEATAVLETLLERKLIRVAGRKETVGRPLLYGTTPDFLRYFNLKTLGDLPPLEAPSSLPPLAPLGSAASDTLAREGTVTALGGSRRDSRKEAPSA
ncbi:MAG: SMC-Scp complex subunit ScpB [Elusimicrobia bacterium]|nr:SMC-Scp complex subunit ScpB [Elusimicrobiota bacterium]